VSDPDETRLLRALDATWPAAAMHPCGGFILRDGQGGGKRVSAASAQDSADTQDIDAAEAGMRRMGQSPIFMIRSRDAALDATLQTRGYAIVDPVVLLSAPVSLLAAPVPPVTVFAIGDPLAIMAEIWAEGGVGPARLAVMHRATGPKTGLLGRTGNRPAGAGFVACDGNIAMTHALHIRPAARRRGLARHMMAFAATWAAGAGASHLSLAVTRANAAALALYASLGMTAVGQYHYRVRTT
jgi:GNAT superfamily N-acetyltransferase